MILIIVMIVIKVFNVDDLMYRCMYVIFVFIVFEGESIINIDYYI